MDRKIATALTIAGSDCSGGAGIQADLKTFSAYGVFGMSVIAAVVAENTRRVISVQDIEPHTIADQIDAVFEDIPPDAVKIGMLSTPATMEAVASSLARHAPDKVVVDPVMYAKNGAPLMEPDAIGTLTSRILPHAMLLTPNIPEAERLGGMAIASIPDMKEAAVRIHALGPRAVLVKGGHKGEEAADILFDGHRFICFSAERIDTKNTHGTGCTYSSAIASGLALGFSLEDAVRSAKQYITSAILNALPLGKGYGPTGHFHDVYGKGLDAARAAWGESRLVTIRMEVKK